MSSHDHNFHHVTHPRCLLVQLDVLFLALWSIFSHRAAGWLIFNSSGPGQGIAHMVCFVIHHPNAQILFLTSSLYIHLFILSFFLPFAQSCLTCLSSLTPSVDLSVCRRLVGRSVIIFLKVRKVSLRCSYRSTFSIIVFDIWTNITPGLLSFYSY